MCLLCAYCICHSILDTRERYVDGTILLILGAYYIVNTLLFLIVCLDCLCVIRTLFIKST